MMRGFFSKDEATKPRPAAPVARPTIPSRTAVVVKPELHKAVPDLQGPAVVGPSRQESEIAQIPLRLQPLTFAPPDESAASSEQVLERAMSATTPFAQASCMGEVGPFNGIVNLMVPDGLKDRCVVLDTAYNSVIIVCIEGTQDDPLFRNVISTIKQRSLTIGKRVTLDPDAFADLMRVALKKGHSAAADGDKRGVKLFDELVAGAFRIGGSDLHIYLNGANPSDSSEVRLRLSGRMRQWKKLDTAVLATALKSGFNDKGLTGTNTRAQFSDSNPTQTMTEHTVDGKRVLGRFTSYPTQKGAKVVIRLLEADTKKINVKTLLELTYAPSQIALMESALRNNAGLIYLSGSTGSGKSTSLRSMTYAVPNRDDLSMYAVEDPVEYFMPWMDQISVQSGSDETTEDRKRKFLSALRALLRMDPDLVMIGEVRDSESAAIASEMVQTGHRVMTSIHGDSWVDTLSRLCDKELGIDPAILAGRKFISLGVYQKLLPKLCMRCRIPAKTVLAGDKQQLLSKKFHLDVGTMYCANEDGCDRCRIAEIKTGGTKGVEMVAEVFMPSDTQRSLISKKSWPELDHAWRATRKTGFGQEDMTGKTAFEHGLYKVSKGLVDINDLEIDFWPIENHQVVQISEAA